ncbi:hypothetical protein HGRIS_014977 [Hohenbuehelia grisea]|uniref:Uncharacterized protein n=1 Tax=Hohenbuehelia grisea TaxID=104357 RepID=A0ABR3IW30_9AGAR
MVGTGSEHHVLYQYNLNKARNHYMGLIQTETPYFQPIPVAPTPFTINSKYGDPDLSTTPSAWALWVKQSQNITVFGAGLYSFFYNYQQNCIATRTCQKHIVNIDSASTIRIYSLSTVGTTYMLSVNQKGIIDQTNNQNGFAQTATFWSPTVS